jgi:hypothetical protein
VTKAMFRLYSENIHPSQNPDIFSEIRKKYKDDTDRFVDKLFQETFFIDRGKVLEFLDDPSAKTMNKDFGFRTANSIFRKYYNEYNILDDYDLKLDKLKRRYIAGLMEMKPEMNFYPDANFTMRLSYGIVDDYSPRDAVHYDYYTRLKGVIEKEDSTDFEFMVPRKLKELFESGDYGMYGDGDTMPVCFITNNDITGGNSGSPVLNSKGELIGLAFDGNWEAMSGDIVYEPEIQRCICVDIRYVLFIIDKFAGNSRLIEELTIVK